MEGLIEAIGVIFVATLFGSLMFFSFVVAPLIFIKLDSASAGQFIRSIFPWYYLLIGALSLAAGGCFVSTRLIDFSLMLMVFAGAIISRQVLMPKINKARDAMLSGQVTEEKKFNNLHRLSVIINFVQIIIVFAVLIRLVLDLSQFNTI